MKLRLRTSLAMIAALALLYIAPMSATCQQTPVVPNASREATSAQPIHGSRMAIRT